MMFLKMGHWPWLLLGFGCFALALVWQERRFFNWVREHWFFRRSKAHVLSTIFLLIGFALLSVILLDPRAGEIKIKGKIRQDKTIILIDTSTSMLAEDVRPNRLEKAVLIAKHFARKAVGHQIGVMVFADITKKLVPFTSDLDLLDARIDSIKQLRNMNAGSSIGLAIEEAVRFFDPKDDGVSGNILVITDGEDNADTEAFRVPDGISLALVGVGTKAGAPIPMKDNFGMFYGQKKSHGVTVLSKLNEEFFLNAVKEQKHAQYFLAQSYDLPTQQVLDFFNLKKGEEKEGENVVRPVAMEQWSIPALILLALAYLLRFAKPFALVLCILLLPAWAEEKAPEIPPEIQARMEQLRRGELTREEKINLADQLVKYRLHDQAQGLYEENLTQEDAQVRPESYFNWATSELETEKIDSALKRYNELDELSKRKSISPEMQKKIRDNIRRAFVPPPKQDNKKNQQNKDKQENQDQQKNSGGEGQGESGDSKNQQQGQKSQDQKDNKPGEKNPFDPKNKDKGDQGDEKKDQGDDGKKREKDEKGKDPQEGDEGEKKKPKAKLSPLIENLKQDDRKLQLKLLDTSTQKRTERRKKDW